MTDEQIIDLCVRGGETRRFAELVHRYQDRVYGLTLRLTGRAEEAEDLAQEIFVAAWRGLSGFRGDARFSTWLYRIAWNRAADWLRRGAGAARQAAPLEDAGEVADARAGPDADLLASEERRALAEAVAGLDERYRAVIEMLYFQELPYEQIAAVLEVPVRTVETRLYRARRLLRRRLEGESG
jgi:RNA polymerase sigma-70 factor (ECF subfamily)